ADEIDPELGCGDGAAPETEERVHRRPNAIQTVKLQAVLGHTRGKRSRVRAILVAALDRVIGNEPGISSAAPVLGGGPPSADVRFVLVADANPLAVERSASARTEMKDELVAVVDEAIAVDRLVVPDIHVAIEPRRCAGGVAIDRDRLDPVDRVLELQVMA